MKFKIGFTAETNHKNDNSPVPSITDTEAQPKKSVVQIHFPARNLTCSYYNDLFDLHPGDIVYVDGKLEGLRGRVVDLSYTFKIKISDYHRVIGKADTDIKGELHITKSNFITFDRTALPYRKVLSWFKAPDNSEDEYISSTDGESFPLDNLGEMKIQPHIAERGKDYYVENNVAYICIDGTHGQAIVEGSEPYEVEFTYQNGEISGLTCSCYCCYACKHEFAAMLQLREVLRDIEEKYCDEYKQTDYFAAITKDNFFSFVIDGKDEGSFVLK